MFFCIALQFISSFTPNTPAELVVAGKARSVASN